MSARLLKHLEDAENVAGLVCRHERSTNGLNPDFPPMAASTDHSQGLGMLRRCVYATPSVQVPIFPLRPPMIPLDPARPFKTPPTKPITPPRVHRLIPSGARCLDAAPLQARGLVELASTHPLSH
ncbi:hypothetical protein RSAG8_08938, partial [Rhizoctonia solani AG-8 WAC10335]